MFTTFRDWFSTVFKPADMYTTMYVSAPIGEAEEDDSYPRRLMLPELEVKRRSLLAEQRIISAMEEKHSNDPVVVASLSHHRKTVVREELRATILAMTFLKGLPITRVEGNRRPESDRLKIRRRAKVHRMVNKYGDKRVSWNRIKAWDSTVPEKASQQP